MRSNSPIQVDRTIFDEIHFTPAADEIEKLEANWSCKVGKDGSRSFSKPPHVEEDERKQKEKEKKNLVADLRAKLNKGFILDTRVDVLLKRICDIIET